MRDEPEFRLRREVVEPLKSRFVGRDEVVELIALAVVAGEHLFLHGPPGTAKSALIRQFAEATRGQYFEYLLTRFSEPNELFGPIDLARLREGTVATVTTGMLPEAEFAFLDELFNANSAILNNLLSVLNERVYRRGAEVHRLPLLSVFSASNQLPEDDALKALFDRFLLRCHVDHLHRDLLPNLLSAGWNLERSGPLHSTLTSDDLRRLANRVYQVSLANVADRYAEVVGRIRDLGIAMSDRRAVKALKLVAASAVLTGRQEALVADFWVLRYVWDREEQVGPLGGLIDGVLEAAPEVDNPHLMARSTSRPDGETLARGLDEVESEVRSGSLTLSGIARLRERLSDLADQASWLPDETARVHLRQRAGELLERIG